jgi:hypothetical protein
MNTTILNIELQDKLFYLTYGRHPKLELDVMLRIEHDEIDFGKQNTIWKMFMKRTSEANMRIKHS